jgi:hypothetical protein
MGSSWNISQYFYKRTHNTSPVLLAITFWLTPFTGTPERDIHIQLVLSKRLRELPIYGLIYARLEGIFNENENNRTSEVILKKLECPGNRGCSVTSTITKAFLPEAKENAATISNWHEIVCINYNVNVLYRNVCLGDMQCPPQDKLEAWEM